MSSEGYLTVKRLASGESALVGELVDFVKTPTGLQVVTATGPQTLSTATDMAVATAHIANVSNPHSVTKTQVGLNNVDNTSDLNKPVSTATAAAIVAAQVGLLDYRGAFTPSASSGATGFPATGGSGTAGAILKGDTFVASAAGFLLTEAIQIGDIVVANVDAAGQNAAQWDKLNRNIAYVPEDQANRVTSISAGSTDSQYPSAKLAYDQLALKATTAAVNLKQDILVSGTHVKTINNQSILGTGNLDTTAQYPDRLWNPHTDEIVNRQMHFRSDNLSAGVLSTWADMSTNTFQVTAAGDVQPLVVTAALNGYPLVQFDGINDVMTRTAVDLGNSWSLYAVFKTAASVTSGPILSDDFSALAVSYTLGILNGVGNAQCLAVGTFAGAWIVATDTVPLVANTTYIAAATRISGGNLTVFKNGTQVGVTVAGTDPPFNAANSFLLGRRWDTAAGPYFNGSIAEVICFNTAHAAADREKIEGYLAWKYGLQANLPAGHIYKNTYPKALGIPVFANNAAAITGGLTLGQIYRTSLTNGVICAVY